MLLKMTALLVVSFYSRVSLYGQKSCTKYLKVSLDQHLLFKDLINTLQQKSNIANGRLTQKTDTLLAL